MGAYEEKFKATVQGYAVVAFDVFDTLICRDVGRPTDVLAWMEQQGKAPTGYAARRLQAEQTARSHHPHGEVTMDEIYRSLELRQTVECDAELSLCQPCAVGKRLYEYCREQGKQIYIISDMYLPRRVVAAMLQKCGYQGWAGLYVSCDYSVQKRSGRLFKLFLREEKIKPNQVLFVGDDRRADGVGAALAGIRCCLLPAKESFLYAEETDNAAARAVVAFACNRTQNKAREYQLGYGIIGPLLYSFCRWLRQTAAENHREKILFLARDMDLTRKMYATLTPDAQTGYLRVSRRSLCAAVLALTPGDAQDALFLDLLPRQVLNKQELADYCGVPVALIPTQQAELDCKSRPFTPQCLSFAREMRELFCAQAGEVLRQNAAQTQAYLRQEIPNPEDVLLVDIGSGGTIQRAIETILGKPLMGAYLACDDRLHKHLPATRTAVALFGGQPLPVSYRVGQPILELLISEQCGATIGYKLQNGQTAPVMAAAHAPQPLVTKIQAAALDFAAQWKASPLEAWPLMPDAQIQPWMQLVRSPRKEDVSLLGELEVEDGGSWSLASPRSRAYYGVHPKILHQDFAAARWKTGFLTKLLPLGLPYGKWYEALYNKKTTSKNETA